MKKGIAVFLSVCIAVSGITCYASDVEDGEYLLQDIPVWSDGEEISEEFYADILKDIEEREKTEV